MFRGKYVPTRPSQDAISLLSMWLRRSSIWSVPAQRRTEARTWTFARSRGAGESSEDSGAERQASTVATSQAVFGEWPYGYFLFDSDATQVLLPAGWLAREEQGRCSSHPFATHSRHTC